MPQLTKPHPNALSSARVLIFGGTAGIGAAVASGALSHGSNLHISSSSAANIASTISQLQALYPSSSSSPMAGTPADLTDVPNLESNIRAVLDAAIASLGGPLDHIVFTAGDMIARPALAETSVDGVHSSLSVRYLAPLFIAKLVAANPGKYLLAAPSSSITLTGGILGRRPRAGMSSVSSVAGTVETLSRGLAVDLAPIRSNIVVLGPVDTELLRKLAGSEEIVQAFASQTLTKKLGTPEEAAEAYLHCMRNGFVTGQDLVVDGGCVLN